MIHLEETKKTQELRQNSLSSEKLKLQNLGFLEIAESSKQLAFSLNQNLDIIQNFQTLESEERPTANTLFLKAESPSTAESYISENIICIGKDVLTLETVIHELNEIENTFLIRSFLKCDSDSITVIINSEENKISLASMKQLKEKQNRNLLYPKTYHTFVSHLISPYGQYSLINPCKTPYDELATDEDNLLVNENLEVSKILCSAYGLTLKDKHSFLGKLKNLRKIRGKDMMNNKELELSSNPSNRLEIASYGLTIPKMVIERINELKTMNKKENKTIPQAIEGNESLQPLESVIDSKINVKSKMEVKRMKKNVKPVKNLVVSKNAKKSKTVQKKALHKKQRKGKSLLTAFKINRMTRRSHLNLNRPCGAELYRKYY